MVNFIIFPPSNDPKYYRYRIFIVRENTPKRYRFATENDAKDSIETAIKTDKYSVISKCVDKRDRYVIDFGDGKVYALESIDDVTESGVIFLEPGMETNIILPDEVFIYEYSKTFTIIVL